MAQRFVPDFPLDTLIEHPENARRGDVEAIGESIETNGFYGAVIVQESTNRIIVGNHRARAARALSHDTVPAIVIDVDDDQARRIMLADNRTNDIAFYDDRALTSLLASLEGDLVGTGFDDSDLELLLAKIEASEKPEEPDEDATPPVAPEQRVKPGEVWRVGSVRFLCGDSRNSMSLERVLDGAEVTLAFTSPPYANRRKYDLESDFKPIHPDRYVEWFRPVADNVQQHLAVDGSWVVNIRGGATDEVDMETYAYELVLAHCKEWGWHWGAEYCWERIGFPKQPVRRFKNAFEMIYLFSLGPWKFRPDNVRHYSTEVPHARGPGSGAGDWAKKQGIPLRQNYFEGRGNEMSADLAYPSNRIPTFSMGSHVALGHPAAFPPALPRFFVLAYTDAGDAVLDPFMGSGSTLVAAALEDRPSYGIEISPAYCDITLQRLEETLQVEGEMVSGGE